MKSFLVLLAMLLTLTACQKGQDKNKVEVKTPAQEETAAVDTEVEVTETAETAVEPEEGTVMPEDEGIWTVNFEFAKKINLGMCISWGKPVRESQPLFPI